VTGVVVFFAALAGGAGLVGVATAHVARSAALGVLAGVLAVVAGLVHAAHGISIGLGEYDGPLSGYEQLVHDHWLPLLVGYMAAPGLVISAIAAAWRSAASASR
jgi:hypothetical protein